jgi:hypothetical protein
MRTGSNNYIYGYIKNISDFRRSVVRPWVFWRVTHRVLVVVCRRFGTAYWLHLQGYMGSMGCPKRSVGTCQHTLRYIPEERMPTVKN